MSPTRAWTVGEEVAHSVTHGVGLLAAIAGLAVLLVEAAATRDPWRITASAVYASTLVLLYGTSTLYHALSATRARRVFRVLDHSAIFLLIAGTYTPFALVSLRGPWGWTILGIVWGLALLGIAAKAIFGMRRRSTWAWDGWCWWP
jgi:hemolysin III